MMLIRMGDNKLRLINPLDDSLERIKMVFKKQRYKVRPYDNDPGKLKAIKVISRGKKRKGRFHFSIIMTKDNSILIEGHKDRYLRNHFETDHNNSQSKREINRLQGILKKALEIDSSEVVSIKKNFLRDYGQKVT